MTPARTEDTGRRVAVLTHLGRQDAIDSAVRLIEGLHQAGIACSVPAEDLDVLCPRVPADSLQVMEPTGTQAASPYELLIVLGGDGSILRGAEWVMAADIPLLGVNLGHVGFLAEAESSEIPRIVEHVVSGSFDVEERFTVDVTLREHDEVIWSSFAINEVTIDKAARERMLELVLEVDDRPLSRWACDGLLMSTPTGSTAYAFSAGGPVIWPEVDALLIVPLSAHALFARPLVVGPTSVVNVQLVKASSTHGVVWCDGRRSAELRSGMEVEVTQGTHRLRLARLSRAPFTDRLVKKFRLPVDGWRGAAEQDVAARRTWSLPDEGGEP